MKRLHVHVGVTDLDPSIRLHSALFGEEPKALKEDYAKWMLDDRCANFSIFEGNDAKQGIEHLGIQAESTDELSEVYGRLKAADRPILEEGRTTCCCVSAEKRWISDPGGVVWEAFYTDGVARTYGESSTLGTLLECTRETNCCIANVAA